VIAALARAWHAAFLADVDVRPMGLMRIGVGTIVTSMLVERIDVAAAAYSDDGWIPHDVAIHLMDPAHWSIFHTFGAAWQVTAIIALGALAALAFTLGLWTRPMGIVAFVVLASVHVRNPAVLYGGDLTGRTLLFYLLLAPCGAAFSIDADRRRRALARDRLARSEPLPRGGPVLGPVWPVRLLQIQIAIIYFTTGFSKVQGTDYHAGTALGYALANPVFSRFHSFAAPLFRALAPVLAVLTKITLWWELAFAFMLPWRRLRIVALVVGLFVHGGIFVLMDIEWWGPLMMLSYFAFVPGRALDRIWARQVRQARATRWPDRLLLEFDPADAVVVRSAAAIATSDAFRLVRVVPSPGLETRWRLTRRADGTPADSAALHRVLPLWARFIVRGVLR
jgi:hypothetical protein